MNKDKDILAGKKTDTETFVSSIEVHHKPERQDRQCDGHCGKPDNISNTNEAGQTRKIDSGNVQEQIKISPQQSGTFQTNFNAAVKEDSYKLTSLPPNKVLGNS